MFMYMYARPDYNAHRGLVCVSEPLKGRGATEHSSSSGSGGSSSSISGSSIENVHVSAREQACVCEGWRGEERQTRQDSRGKRRESGSEPSLSSPLQEKRESRTLQPGAVGAEDTREISVPFWRRASA